MTSADDPARYATLRDRFDELVELSPAQRSSRLDEVCGSDPVLRERLEALLAADDGLAARSSTNADGRTSDGFMGDPKVDGAADDPAVDPELVLGAAIGRYTLEASLGEGGFGSVWRAVQQTPVHRAVALKVLKRGMDTRLIVTRFRAEMQALASMDSPHIAKILDAGATRSGRPFFVMELVDGAPITHFCDRERLPLRERIELLIQVCEAIQHAHQKGVFHRDIKPGNVLATRRHGRPFATVIDFGIAKATEPVVQGEEAITVQGQRLGTPSYMSAEQMRGETDIDARADVHAIGVLLCELATGDTPLGWAGLSAAPFAERERFVADGHAGHPSALLAGAAPSRRASIASLRGTTATQLASAVRGDLDWMIARATDPDRERRYASASELAADLRRHLAGEPVLAGPPDTLYRLGKFVRRHRRGVAAAASVAIALVLGLLGTTVGLLRARAALEEARLRERETAAVAEFQGRMLAGVDADALGARLLTEIADRQAALETTDRTDTEVESDASSASLPTFRQSLDAVNGTDVASWLIAAAMLDPAVGALDESGELSPVSRVQLATNLADAYAQLGKLDAALMLRRTALETGREHLGQDDHLTLAALHDFGETLLRAGAFDEAEPALRDAATRRRAVLGPDAEDSVASLARHGEVLLALGRIDDAAPPIETSLRMRLARFGIDHADSIDSLSLAGALALARGDLATSEAQHTEAADAARRLWGDQSPQARTLYVSIMTRLIRQGRIAEAEPYARRALAADRSRLGEDHPETLRSWARLGAVLSTGTKLEEAESICRGVHGRTAVRYGDAHPATVAALSNLARCVQLRGRLAEALPLHLEALRQGAALWGDAGIQTLSLRSNAGVALLLLGRLDDAEPLLAAALEGRKAALPPDHPDTIQSVMILGVTRHQRGETEAAIPLLREALRWRQGALAPGHPDTLDGMERLAAALADAGHRDDAKAILIDALALRRRAEVEEDPTTALGTATTAAGLADVLRRTGVWDEAEPLAREALATRERLLGPRHPSTLESMLALALIDRDAARLDDAELRLRAAFDLCAASAAPTGSSDSSASDLGLTPLLIAVELAALLVATDRHRDAEALLLERAERAWADLSPGHALRTRVAREMDALYTTWPPTATAPADPTGASRWHERRAACASTRS